MPGSLSCIFERRLPFHVEAFIPHRERGFLRQVLIFQARVGPGFRELRGGFRQRKPKLLEIERGPIHHEEKTYMGGDRKQVRDPPFLKLRAPVHGESEDSEWLARSSGF